MHLKVSKESQAFGYINPYEILKASKAQHFIWESRKKKKEEKMAIFFLFLDTPLCAFVKYLT